MTRGIAALEGRTAENKSLKDANKKEVSETIKSLKTSAPYNPQQVENLMQKSASIGDVESYNKLIVYRWMHGWKQGIEGQPLAKQTAALAEMQGGDLALMMKESGGNPAAMNKFGYAGAWQYGAPRLETLGVYQPGSGEDMASWSWTGRDEGGKLSGTFNIPGHPEVKTVRDFLGSTKAQLAVRQADIARMDQDIAANGLNQYVGQTVGGVTITQSSLRNMLHLGGVGGARAFLESDGRNNPADANGTTVGDYARMGSRVTGDAGAGAWIGPVVIEAANDMTKHVGAQVEKSISTLETSIGRGDPPNKQEIADIATAIRITGRYDLVPRIEKAMAAADQAQIGLALPVSLRETFRATLRQTAAESADPAMRQAAAMAEEIFRQNDKNMQERPYTTSASRRGHNPPMPLIFDDPGSIDAAVQQRAGIDRINRHMDGTPARSIFEGQEGEAFKQAMAQGGPATVTGTFNAIMKLDDDQLAATFADGAMKDGIRGALRSADPAKYNATMSALDGAYRRAPETFIKSFGGDTWNELKTWQTLLRYTEPGKVAEIRAKADDPQVREQRKRNEDEGLKEARKKDIGEIVKGFDTSLPITPGPVARALGSQPLPPVDAWTRDVLMGDYQTIYARRYAETLDSDAAHKDTIEMLRTKWARSEVTAAR
jgi:hypothetical protein